MGVPNVATQENSTRATHVWPESRRGLADKFESGTSYRTDGLVTGWRVRVLLEWQRLVNGGRVMAKRSGTVGVMGAQLRRPSEDAERDAQHVQPDAHEAGASGSCDAVTLDMTEASPRSQVPAVETCINASVTRTRRTDTTLTLRYAARVQLTGHLDGRLAHARRKRGDG